MAEVRQEKIDPEGELQVDEKQRGFSINLGCKKGDAVIGRDSVEAGREQCRRVTQFCAVPTESQRSGDAGGQGGFFRGHFSSGNL